VAGFPARFTIGGMPPRYPTRLLTPDEFVVLVRNPHWWTIAAPAALFLLDAVLALWLLFAAPLGDPWSVVAACVLLIPAVVFLLVRLVSWRFTTYVVTNERLVVRAGVLARSGTEIPLESIVNVSFSQSLFERILRSGDLDIESAGTSGQAHYENVSDPEGMQTILYRLREVRSMGLRGVDEGSTPEDHIRFFTQRGLMSAREARNALAHAVPQR